MFTKTAIEVGFDRVDMIRGSNKKEWVVVRDPKDPAKTAIVAQGHLFKMQDTLVRERIAAALQALGWPIEAARAQSYLYGRDAEDWRQFVRKHKMWGTPVALVGKIDVVAKENAPDVGGISGTTTPTPATTGL